MAVDGYLQHAAAAAAAVIDSPIGLSLDSLVVLFYSIPDFLGSLLILA